jgi:NAD(P)-dependent dehydrogenase (short-subunit alcohol dehydrogenase family)
VRVLVVGASGRLGSAVVSALSERQEVVAASRSGEHFVDLTNPASIAGLFTAVGPVDAVACTAGKTPYGALTELSSDQWLAGVRDKLLGQVELVRLGMGHVADGGSFTLVSGILSEQPVPTSPIASTVDGGVDAFVRSAAIELLPRGLRINAVSATVFAEARDAYGAMFPGATPVPVAEAAAAYVASIEGSATGQVLKVGD